jgi:hypothetical protein
MEGKNNKGTFIVKVMDTRNATWQGSILWVDEKKEQKFRSALELIKLMKEALEDSEKEQ